MESPSFTKSRPTTALDLHLWTVTGANPVHLIYIRPQTFYLYILYVYNISTLYMLHPLQLT